MAGNHPDKLAWVIRDFIAYAPGGKATRFHTDQIIQVSNEKLSELERAGYLLPVVFCNKPSITPMKAITA